MSWPVKVSSIIVLGIIVLGGFVNSSTLRADVVYSNFGTGDAYAAGTGLLVTNDGMAYSSVAIGFTPSANYYLSSIEFVATDLFADTSDAVTLGIFADNGGQPGGAPIESFTSTALGQFGDTVPILTVSSVLQPLLQAGTPYWIGMNAPVGFVIWNQNTTGADGFAETDGAGNWSAAASDQGVIEIYGTLAPVLPVVQASFDSGPATPEPQTWWLMACGVAAIALLRRSTRALPPPETKTP